MIILKDLLSAFVLGSTLNGAAHPPFFSRSRTYLRHETRARIRYLCLAASPLGIMYLRAFALPLAGGVFSPAELTEWRNPRGLRAVHGQRAVVPAAAITTFTEGFAPKATRRNSGVGRPSPLFRRGRQPPPDNLRLVLATWPLASGRVPSFLGRFVPTRLNLAMRPRQGCSPFRGTEIARSAAALLAYPAKLPGLFRAAAGYPLLTDCVRPALHSIYV